MGVRLRSNKALQAFALSNSEPIALGAIQLPSDGQPIVLGPDRQSMGGYPTVGCLTRESLGDLFQAAPDTPISFEAVSIQAAQLRLQTLQRFYEN